MATTARVEHTVSSSDPFLANERVFEQQRKQLLRTHQGRYVAIHDGAVVDQDISDVALAHRMFDRFGDAPFYIGKVEDALTVYELPSPESQY